MVRKTICIFAAASVLACTASINAFAYNAAWDARAFEDDNYENYSGMPADCAIDGWIESAWQKEAEIMDEEGRLDRECFLAFEWDVPMEFETMEIWWRSSTRAEASTNGYVVQTGRASGGSVIWEDINVVYSYDSDIMDGGRFVCDTVSFPGGTSAKYLRILVKRGVDYERGYSPKINEVEITAEESEGAGDGDEESSETVTGSEVSSESGLGQESGTVSEETSQITVPQMPAGGTADSAGQTRGWMDFIPWITVACISLAVTAASVAVIIVERRKDPRGGETEIEDEKTK